MEKKFKKNKLLISNLKRKPIYQCNDNKKSILMIW